jgi:cell wall-associated NlpC family hydrolase
MSPDRARIVAVAQSWIGTPYRHRGRIRGAGVDCAMLAAEVYREAGAIPDFPIEDYPPDWHLHRDTERYLAYVLDHAREISVDQAAPGDLALFKVGRAFAHGGIVGAGGWPAIIHAWRPAGSVIEDRGDGGELAGRPVRIFSVVI